ncbi:TIGR01666 family membrane protein [Stenotrophomonas sp. CFBP 13724]|jgi:YccS/YhfK family integral membrane protein|uniref:YccS family putative transporter n=1 Tax=Stenotrophomonas sp. CFBP 13724 TaxID=2775298 RepID=UPI00177EA2A9|nr:YccS family putative transporter [Stenotrophomonas sp. CFBP 13724]MBD8645271.1 TIGR01666 family membrane protein [Stenotrophomonas sp. CFBP 13724]
MSARESRLSRLWAHEKASYGLRVFIALSTAMAVCWHFDALPALPGVFLGIIASAIAETDDNAWGRTKAVVLSLLCFCIAAAAVVWLFPLPWVFISALALSTFCLTLLGGLGERYASIAQATVTLAIYTMIGLEQHGAGDWRTALDAVSHLLAGATWYGLLSILWTALFANRPVRERVARLYVELGRYLQLKATLFEPVREADLQRRQLALAEQNRRVVEALNIAKTAILARFGRSGRPAVNSGLYLRLYYTAQDFHERASSSHYPYGALVDAFFHSDVLYRCQRLLDLQGQACARLGEAIRVRRPFAYGDSNQQAARDLVDSLAFLRAQDRPQWRRLLASLDLLVHNLQSIGRRLLDAENSDATLDNVDTRLRDNNPHTLREMATRLRQQLTPGSVLFRHGLRMAIALVVGFAAISLFNFQNGSWVLLTIVFVCRPNFGATRQRLAQRIAGTLGGLVLTWALLQLFQDLHSQLLIALLSALLFFFTRTDRYLVASGAITVMALTCFNLIGDGFLLIVPRMVDTVLGCAIAAAAAFLILPDWQGRQLNKVLARVLDSAARYLEAVLGQYRSGMRDDLAYRIARRDMHNADAALSTALSNMLREPGHVRRNLDASFRFLALSNTLLGHLSALGAHRDQVDSFAQDPLALSAGERVQQSLKQLATALAERQPIVEDDGEGDRGIAAQLEQFEDAMPPKLQLIRTQVALALRLLPKLRRAADEAVQGPVRERTANG